MARHRRPRKKHAKKKAKKPRSPFFLLDQFTLSDIRKWNKLRDQILKFHWEFYSGLAYQRSTLIDEMKNALLSACQKEFTFTKWQRTVKYKYSLEPLSVAGSLIDPGGRFNIGDIDPARFRPFPGLYIASDRETALQELLCQRFSPKEEAKAFNLALTNPQSITSAFLPKSLFNAR